MLALAAVAYSDRSLFLRRIGNMWGWDELLDVCLGKCRAWQLAEVAAQIMGHG